MGNLVNALILFSTVVMSVTLGIAAAYGLVVGLLHAFGSQRKPAKVQRPLPVPVMLASESHASGD